MSHGTFQKLCLELQPYVLRTSIRKPLDLDLAVALVLHKLAHNLSAKTIAEEFGVRASTNVEYTKLLTSILSDLQKLGGRYISMPTGPRLQAVTARFRQETGLCNCVGSLDGLYIPLHRKPPAKYDPAAYWYRNEMHALYCRPSVTSTNCSWTFLV